MTKRRDNKQDRKAKANMDESGLAPEKENLSTTKHLPHWSKKQTPVKQEAIAGISTIAQATKRSEGMPFATRRLPN